MLREQTQQHISRLSDEDLLAYLRAFDDYEPDAVEFAREELQRRNLDADRISELSQIVVEREIQTAHAVIVTSTSPLGKKGRILAYIAGIFLFGILFLFVIVQAKDFKNRGEIQKSKDVWSYFWYGAFTTFGLIGGCGLIITILDRWIR